MPITIGPRDARREVMRGNAAPALIGKPKAEAEAKATPTISQPAPEPEDITPAIDRMAAVIGEAVTQVGTLQADALRALPVPAQAPRKWAFRITERDRAGNIIAFTAEAVK